MSAFYKNSEFNTWKVGNYCAVPQGTCVLLNCGDNYVSIETIEGRGLIPRQLVTNIVKENNEPYSSMSEFMEAASDFFQTKK